MAKRCGMGAEEALVLVKERVRVLRSHVAAARAADVDGIHDLRVASRRLRAALKVNAHVFGSTELKAFRDHVKGVTRLLGTARELDVCLGLLADLRRDCEAAAKPAVQQVAGRLAALRARESAAVAEGAGLVESPAFNSMLIALFESVSPSSRCYIREAVKRLRKRVRRVVKLHARWQDEPSEERLHQVRIAFKKLRYGCEAYSGLYGKPMKSFLKQLRAAQEALGQWNDYRVLRNYIQDLAPATGPPPSEAMLALSGAVEAHVARHLEEFRSFSKRFFSPGRLAKAETMLGETTRPCCEFTS